MGVLKLHEVGTARLGRDNLPQYRLDPFPIYKNSCIFEPGDSCRN